LATIHPAALPGYYKIPLHLKTPLGARGSLTLWEFDEGVIEENLE